MTKIQTHKDHKANSEEGTDYKPVSSDSNVIKSTVLTDRPPKE